MAKHTVGDIDYYVCDECGFKCTSEDTEVGDITVIDVNMPWKQAYLVFCPDCIMKYKLLRKLKGGYFG